MLACAGLFFQSIRAGRPEFAQGRLIAFIVFIYTVSSTTFSRCSIHPTHYAESKE